MSYRALTPDEIAQFIQDNREFPFWMKLRTLVKSLYGPQARKVVVEYDTEELQSWASMQIIRGVLDVRVYNEKDEQMDMDLNSPLLAGYFQQYANYHPGLTPQTASPDSLQEARIAIKDQFIDYFPRPSKETTYDKHPEATYDIDVPPQLTIAELFVKEPA